MSDISPWALLLALVTLVLISALFSMSETSLMSVNRYRMKHLASKGRRGAKQVLALLAKTDRLLATVLLGNNLVNAALSTVITAFAIYSFGNNDEVLALATAVSATLLIIFGEIIPKVIGANRPEAVAMGSSFWLTPLVTLLSPLVWAINLLVSGLLGLFRLTSKQGSQAGLTTEDLRAAVLESTAFIPSQHRSILLNLIDLEDLTVDDVMIPRGRIEALNLEDSDAAILEQMSTSFHNKLPVFRGDLSQIEGVLYVRKAIGMLAHDGFRKEALIESLQPPYYIPSGTSLFTQMTFFQQNPSRLAMVVDEYGEVLGLVTLQDIVEEMMGELSTEGPSPHGKRLEWDEDRTVTVDGVSLVRDLNRRLGLSLPIDGPRTINGLILEALQDIPESNLSLKINGVALEILQVQGRVIRRVLIHRPASLHDDNSELVG